MRDQLYKAGVPMIWWQMAALYCSQGSSDIYCMHGSGSLGLSCEPLSSLTPC